ncbi:MAG: YHS domain-containing protein [Pseudomonadota bacterium]
MSKLIVFLFLSYLGYRVINWLFNTPSIGKPEENSSPGKIDDLMVKDPYCNAYFPKRNAVKASIEGKEYLFCSEECKEKFIKKMMAS